MKARLVQSQIVVFGNYFDPSIVTRDWILHHEIVPDTAIHDSSFFDPGVVKMVTSDAEFLMMAPQFQVVPHEVGIDNEIIAQEMTKRLVDALPADTPIDAISLNLNWHVWPEQRDVPQLSRQLFFVPWNPIHRRFDQKDSLFGSYMSANMFGGRMKLSVRPVETSLGNGKPQLRLSFSFNFEAHISRDDEFSKLTAHLDRWKEAKNMSKLIIKEVVNVKSSEGLKGLANRIRQRAAQNAAAS